MLNSKSEIAGSVPVDNCIKLREATLFQSISPFIIVIALLIVGYGILGIRIEILLLLASAWAGGVARRVGLNYQEMQEGINNGLYQSMTALLIVVIVGAMVASWIASGTIPMLVYYGMQFISPSLFYISSCLICSLVALVTGTSWGAAGTMGVALMGIASGINADLAITAGAIISGAYFGDKLSPFSDTTNLAPAATKANLYDHIGHMLWTTIPAYLAALVIYLMLGLQLAEVSDPQGFERLGEAIKANFEIAGWSAVFLLLPAVITLGGALLKYPVIPAMLLSCVVAVFLAAWLQNPPYEYTHSLLNENNWRYQLQQLLWPIIYPLQAMVFGFQVDTGLPALDSLLNRGGMQSTMDTMLIALCAFAFAGIVQKANLLERLLELLLKFATTTGKLIFSSSLATATIAVCTGNSYLSILLTGQLFAKTFKQNGLAAKNLSRTTEDSGTVLVPLVPWSIAGVYMSGILGVSVLDYAPWAILCYGSILVAWFYGFTGFCIAPLRQEDETVPGS